MISLKLKDILCENSTMDLTYLMSLSNGANIKSKLMLFILYSVIKILSQFYHIPKEQSCFYMRV